MEAGVCALLSGMGTRVRRKSLMVALAAVIAAAITWGPDMFPVDEPKDKVVTYYYRTKVVRAEGKKVRVILASPYRR